MTFLKHQKKNLILKKLSIYIFYFIKKISKIKKKKKIKNIVFKSPNEIDSIENSLYELEYCKCIYIKRDIFGLVKSRALDLNIRKKKTIAYYFKRILFSKYIENIKNNYRRIDMIKKEFPKKLYITSLEKIVFDTKNEMTKITKFLNLKQNKEFFYPSYNGQIAERDHINKINDDKILISNNLTNLYNLRMHGLSYYINNPSKFSFVNIITYFYIIAKNFIIFKND